MSSDKENSAEESLYEELKEFRSFIRAADQKAQEDFDKTVLVLSGGALGISMTFLKDIAGDDPLVPWA